MPFLIKDLMVAVAPFAAENLAVDCLTSLRVCQIDACPDVSLQICMASVCRGGSLAGGCDGGCSNDFSCYGCTNTCDAGCSRIQCSNYPTNNFTVQLGDIAAAELLLLRAELRLARQGKPVPSIGAAPERAKTVNELNQLEKHLEEALNEVRAERDRRPKSK